MGQIKSVEEFRKLNEAGLVRYVKYRDGGEAILDEPAYPEWQPITSRGIQKMIDNKRFWYYVEED